MVLSDSWPLVSFKVKNKLAFLRQKTQQKPAKNPAQNQRAKNQTNQQQKTVTCGMCSYDLQKFLSVLFVVCQQRQNNAKFFWLTIEGTAQ